MGGDPGPLTRPCNGLQSTLLAGDKMEHWTKNEEAAF
jgi:hypothetical protein